ncbi:dTDP-4-dehydrorhamnose reductase [Aurantivibrio infirmus]
MNIASKRVLIIGVDSDVASKIFDGLDSGNQPVVGIKSSDIDWESSEEVGRLLETHTPFLVVNFLGTPLFKLELEDPYPYFKSAIKNIASSCAAVNAIAVHISDYHVFGGDRKNSYLEKDPVSPLSDYGEMLVSAEKCFEESLESFLILRFSWIIDTTTENILTKTLKGLGSSEGVELSAYRRGAPTWQDDIIRVINTVIRQVMSGATNWGYFHYCSADTCNEFEFGQQVQTAYAEFLEAKGEIISAAATHEDETESNNSIDTLKIKSLEPISAALSCKRIENNFGVRPRSWRQGLTSRIKMWAEETGLLEPDQLATDVQLKK